MGYQPALDGLRAVSVVAVVLYHAGFDWMRGGFFGVEVFFVVSGFLITVLLREERARSGGTDLRGFWIRRARRLLPALVAVIVATACWALVAGSDQQRSDVRRDGPWALLYVGNWGQILGDVPYFGGRPSLLRHLWSLGVEEQWYLVWPLVFIVLGSLVRRRRACGAVVVVAAIVAMGFTWWLASGSGSELDGPPDLFAGVDRINFLYLSTITRSSGLLLGAAGAFLWQPWRRTPLGFRRSNSAIDPLAFAAMTGLGIAFVVTELTERYVYRWLLGVVSLLSLVVVLAATHPSAIRFRSTMSRPALVEIGKRSYGVYLWSWPIFVIAGATNGSWWRFAVATIVTVPVVQASYRFIEVPIRRGVLGRWWAKRPSLLVVPTVGAVVATVLLVVSFANVEPFDPLRRGGEATFDARSVRAERDRPQAPPVSVGAVVPAPPDDAPRVVPTTQPAPTSTSPALDRARLAVVGDSTADALVTNQPDGIEQVFPEITSGGIVGCGVWDIGRIRTEANFANEFDRCTGWQDQWRAAAAPADVAMVVIGAWDVFDVVVDDDTVYEFATPAADDAFRFNLTTGINAILSEGVNVALLEIPCMRPIDIGDEWVVALPERGDDARVAHLNGLMRTVAAGFGPEVQFVDGPQEWCGEPPAGDLAFRWDGIHVAVDGAKLLYETVTADLLAIASVP